MSGVVIPSNIRRFFQPDNFDGGAYDNIPLRLGEIADVLYPDDERNLSGRFVEYKVVVQHRSGGTAVTKVYDNCLLANLYGSLADKKFFTLRADPESLTTGTAVPSKGAKVLLACINGESNNAVIIGGITDQKDEFQKDLKKDDKDFSSYELFNGIEHIINKDGELTITYKGATKLDGTTDVSDDVAGSFVKWDKDGNITVSDKDGKNAVIVNHKDGKVIIARDKNFELGEATDEMLLGKSFRDEQSKMHQKINGYNAVLKNLLQVVGSNLTTAGTTPIAPGSTLPTLGVAGALMLQVAQQIGNIDQAIQDFENAAQGKNGFLSKKNKAD